MDKEKLKSELEKNRDISAAILYGSFAKGFANDQSDIDVAILFKKVPDPIALFSIKQELSDAMKSDVDVISLNSASPIICMQAIKSGIPLFINDKRAYDEFEMRLITDYADLKKLREPFEKDILKRKLQHD